jgi:predicted enzyme related to lactoylglutathione lyase
MPHSPTPAVHGRYVHTNLIAADWQALARFYETVFGCVRVPPERDLAGPAMEAGTGIPAAHLVGIHLCLPGYGDAGPTLEIFTYDRLADRLATAVNRPGFGHLAFSVANVAAARAAVLAAGGRPVGEVVTVEVKGGGHVTWCYVTDPEGNVIELQAWADQAHLRGNLADRLPQA